MWRMRLLATHCLRGEEADRSRRRREDRRPEDRPVETQDSEDPRPELIVAGGHYQRDD